MQYSSLFETQARGYFRGSSCEYHQSDICAKVWCSSGPIRDLFFPLNICVCMFMQTLSTRERSRRRKGQRWKELDQRQEVEKKRRWESWVGRIMSFPLWAERVKDEGAGVKGRALNAAAASSSSLLQNKPGYQQYTMHSWTHRESFPGLLLCDSLAKSVLQKLYAIFIINQPKNKKCTTQLPKAQTDVFHRLILFNQHFKVKQIFIYYQKLKRKLVNSSISEAENVWHFCLKLINYWSPIHAG